MSNTTRPKQAKRITAKLKSRIMSEILLPGASIPRIAEKYDLSSATLYGWRTCHNKRLDQGSDDFGSKGGGFIELLPEESGKLLSSKSKLSQISLILGDISLSIKGSVKTSSLVKILTALEESC